MDITEFWKELEEEFSTELQPIFDVYRNLSIQDIIDEAKEIMNGKPFRKQIDKQELRDYENPMFEPDYDIEFECFCKAN